MFCFCMEMMLVRRIKWPKSELMCCVLVVQGIYRVNGAKSRVEKLCQVFENGKDLVELSDLYPHDISNVLKLYLRQVGFTHTILQDKIFAGYRVHRTDHTLAQ